MREGQRGFCGVRMNQGGRLVSLNYGKSVHITEETIETEAVNHFLPGERILSLGNLGCMLNCKYCHNWKTSQARYVEAKDVHQYTPEGIVETALRHGIRCLSWTYNDPVVWQEFVIDTARLAQQEGLLNLYKSAFFISPEAIDQLIPYMDIFSISVKCIDPEFYRTITTGWLQPVLDGAVQVYRAGRHVEISNLMVTDINDDAENARRIAAWVLDSLDAKVPLHYVRFHPDYKMRNTTRTPIPRVLRAHTLAREMGVEHVYVGNVYDTQSSNSYCSSCDAELVTRYGLNARVTGLDESGACRACGKDNHFTLRKDRSVRPTVEVLPPGTDVRSFDWHGDIRSVHVEVANTNSTSTPVYHRRRYAGGSEQPWQIVTLQPQESWRFILAKAEERELGPEVAVPAGVDSNLHEVFDRAHFPTLNIEEAGAVPSDSTPMPYFQGTQAPITIHLGRKPVPVAPAERPAPAR
jgi:pyruvate formate lyase activating enzyme